MGSVNLRNVWSRDLHSNASKAAVPARSRQQRRLPECCVFKVVITSRIATIIIWHFANESWQCIASCHLRICQQFLLKRYSYSSLLCHLSVPWRQAVKYFNTILYRYARNIYHKKKKIHGFTDCNRGVYWLIKQDAKGFPLSIEIMTNIDVINR